MVGRKSPPTPQLLGLPSLSGPLPVLPLSNVVLGDLEWLTLSQSLLYLDSILGREDFSQAGIRVGVQPITMGRGQGPGGTLACVGISGKAQPPTGKSSVTLGSMGAGLHSHVHTGLNHARV